MTQPPPHPRVVLEICVETPDDARLAVTAGADRLEINAALPLGGLTPTPGTVRAIRDAIPPRIPLVAMLRPRPGGFHYSDREFETMRLDLRWLKSPESGLQAVAFGILNPDATLDLPRNRILVREAQPLRAVFHRAFDLVPDPETALEQLVELGFHRILSSGAADTAYNGARTLAKLRKLAQNRIEILPAAGIRPQNALQVLRESNADQLHASARTPVQDPTAEANPAVDFAKPRNLPRNQHETADDTLVRNLRAAVDATNQQTPE